MPRNDLKAYGSVIARIPQDLLDQVKQYASQHRCSVSELIRDGLEMRLEAGVPGRSTPRSADHGEEVLHAVLQTLSPMLMAQIQTTIRTTLAEVLPGRTSTPQPASPLAEHGNTSVVPIVPTILQPSTEVVPGHTSTPQAHASITAEGHTEVLHTGSSRQRPQQKGIPSVIPQAPPVPQAPRTHARQSETSLEGYDASKFYVGQKLCPKGHA